MTDERLVDPNDPPLERFRVGDHVAHLNCGDGVVTAIEHGEVCVTYERKDSGGSHWKGRYGGRWFELHPGWLFHHTTRATP